MGMATFVIGVIFVIDFEYSASNIPKIYEWFKEMLVMG